MHLEALTDDGRRLLPHFKKFGRFYLAEGTALALQIGHRVSEDFDFFQAKPIPRSLLRRVEEVFADRTRHMQVSNADELTLYIDDTKITFLAYPFPVLNPLVTWQGLRLASVPEIGAMKAYTIGRRGALKDYIDLYLILKTGLTLPKLIRSAEQKYGRDFSTRLFLEQLVYFDDLPPTRLSFLGATISRRTLEDFFKNEIKKVPL